ncbi:MAG TPA: 2-oxoglutarate and iron-dependent oxygenase domain-containing protein [Methylophilaceae bacterium]|nr:2-oxoglutarate and iron-dependent oxygenase domain-containing protein [Methylophilaceae bacterium]
MSDVQMTANSQHITSPNINTPHTAFKQLPVVDISLLFSADIAERKQAAKALGQAARDAGFLYVVGHGVPQHLIENLKVRTREYFAQSLEQKMQDYIGNSNNHSGYVPEGEEQFYSAKPDIKEAYDVGFDLQDPEKHRPMLGPDRWPEFPDFKADIKAYYDAVYALSNVLFRGFALALDLPEDSFTRLISAPPSQLRLVHYPFTPDAPEDRPGIGAHTDYECFTILLATEDGLEVQNGEAEWIDAPVVEGAFVMNIGDMLEVFSNGYYVATMHRVRKVKLERYSFPLFCAVDYDTVVQPIPLLLSPDSPARYEPLICGEHLYAQTMQTFAYLKKRLADGSLQLPQGAKALSSFGHKTQAPATVTEVSE